MEELKKQMIQKYPFMQKVGVISTNFNKRKLLRRTQKEKTLIFVMGVQGVGKTTYCKKTFSDYQVVNIDEILAEYLKTYKGPISPKIDIDVHSIFYREIEQNLENSKVAIVEAGVVDLVTRVRMLERLQNSYTKVILLVINREKNRIRKQIEGDIGKRARPDLWEDFETEFGFLQIQIKEHIIEMGVDEVYFI